MTVEITPEARERIAQNLIKAGYIESNKRGGVVVVEPHTPPRSAASGR